MYDIHKSYNEMFYALIEIRVVSLLSQVFQRSPFLLLCSRMDFDGKIAF